MSPELAFQVRGSYPALLDAAEFCEQNEIVAMALPDHYLASRSDRTFPTYDALTQLAGLARDTSTLELSTLVSPVTFRHPAVTLKAAVSIDEMSGGRFSLGLGTGWFAEEHESFGIAFPTERFDILEDALGYTRAGIEGGGHAGTHFQLEAFGMQPSPSNLRIVVGGSGPTRTPDLAGRFADEFNVYCGPRAEMLAKIRAARSAAEQAGRDPDRILISSAGVVVTGTNQELYRSALELAAGNLQQDPDELETSLRDQGIPTGLRANEMMEELSDIGVDRFYLQMFGTDPARRSDMLVALRG